MTAALLVSLKNTHEQNCGGGNHQCSGLCHRCRRVGQLSVSRHFACSQNHSMFYGVHACPVHGLQKRLAPLLTFSQFTRHITAAICCVTPTYPILAVMISFGFMLVISLWEALKLPEEWLNMPIYYGTLYGPFSFIYYIVKKCVLLDYYSLPTTTTTKE
jgi:hypothetical protein